jgi:hypothetical protein
MTLEQLSEYASKLEEMLESYWDEENEIVLDEIAYFEHVIREFGGAPVRRKLGEPLENFADRIEQQVLQYDFY